MLLLLLLDTLLSAALFPFLYRTLRGLRAYVSVPLAPPPAVGQAPRVAVLVPARDEARSIEACVGSLLAQAYPRERFEVLAIDDRSTDATPEILGRLAATAPNLRVLQGAPLPDGWMGKCWALHQAAHVAEARRPVEYLLFVDADTVHAPEMLASTIALADREHLDLLSLGPGQILGTLAERVLLPTILATVMSNNGTLDEVNDPRRRDVAKAVGQFMLFRASTYRAIGGHEAVKAEIVEDFALARVVKRAGYRLLMADGGHLVLTRMYQSAHEVWNGFSKNAYDEAQRQRGGAWYGLAGLPIVALGPYLLLAAGWSGLRRHGRWQAAALFVQASTQVAAVLLLSGVSARVFGQPWRYAAAQPIATLFLWGVLANSTWRTLSGRGVAWKGRTYHAPS